MCGGYVVEDTEHGHNAVGLAISASNVRARGTDVVARQTNAAGRLADLCALLECLVDALDRVIGHGQQKATVRKRERRVRQNCLVWGGVSYLLI